MKEGIYDADVRKHADKLDGGREAKKHKLMHAREGRLGRRNAKAGRIRQ